MRIVLLWQVLLTVAAVPFAAYFSALHGALSAALGGAVSMTAGLLFASIATVRKGRSADDVLLTAFKAEGAKLLFIVIALGLVLAAYRNVVAAVFIGTFIATILISSMAFFVSNKRG